MVVTGRGRSIRRGAAAAAAVILLLGGGAARAEGTAQVGANQDLFEYTDIYVDIVSAGEVINISAGNNSATASTPVDVYVYDSPGHQVAGSPFRLQPGSAGFLRTPDLLPPTTIANPLRIVTTRAGTWMIEFDHTGDAKDNTAISNVDYPITIDPFDVTVTAGAGDTVSPGSPPGGYGRVWANVWYFNGHAFDQAHSCSANFYILVPGVFANTDFTWLLDFTGMSGYYFSVMGNRHGLEAPFSGFSEFELVSCGADPALPASWRSDLAFAPELPIYLGVPEIAQGPGADPAASGYAIHSVGGHCDIVAPGALSGEFIFTAANATSFQIVVDVNRDGVYDPAGGDVVLGGTAVTGINRVSWNGRDNHGNPVPPGSYNARLSLRAGEFHFVAQDIETSWPGLRIFEINPPLAATTPASTRMYWNDADLCHRATLPVVSTLPDGVLSGSYLSPVTPGVNAHGWGNFTAANSPGDNALVDTYVFSRQVFAFTAVVVVSASLDSDGDGVTDAVECLAGLDPGDRDSDDDGLEDGVEDADRDGTRDAGETDPLDPDSDDDGLLDGTEDVDRDGTRDAGETDPLDPDTDDGGVDDGTEVNRGTDPLDPSDDYPPEAVEGPEGSEEDDAAAEAAADEPVEAADDGDAAAGDDEAGGEDGGAAGDSSSDSAEQGDLALEPVEAKPGCSCVLAA